MGHFPWLGTWIDITIGFDWKMGQTVCPNMGPPKLSKLLVTLLFMGRHVWFWDSGRQPKPTCGEVGACGWCVNDMGVSENGVYHQNNVTMEHHHLH